MDLHYIARRRLTVAGRTVEPGEIVPEATSWRNVKAYVDNGSLAVGVNVSDEAVANAELKAQLAFISARVAALEAQRVEQPDAASPIDGPALPLVSDQTTADAPLDTTVPIGEPALLEPSDMPGSGAISPIPALDENDPDEQVADVEPPAASTLDMDALEKLTRPELDARAAALGIDDAARLGSKRAVLAAIQERHAATVTAPGSEN
jgi:hypothetical protein